MYIDILRTLTNNGNNNRNLIGLIGLIAISGAVCRQQAALGLRGEQIPADVHALRVCFAQGGRGGAHGRDDGRGDGRGCGRRRTGRLLDPALERGRV